MHASSCKIGRRNEFIARSASAFQRKESTYSASRISMRSSLPVSGTRTRGLRSARNTSQTRVSVSDTATSSSVGRGGLRCRGHEGSPADLTISCAQGIVGMYSSNLMRALCPSSTGVDGRLEKASKNNVIHSLARLQDRTSAHSCPPVRVAHNFLVGRKQSVPVHLVHHTGCICISSVQDAELTVVNITASCGGVSLRCGSPT